MTIKQRSAAIAVLAIIVAGCSSPTSGTADSPPSSPQQPPVSTPASAAPSTTPTIATSTVTTTVTATNPTGSPPGPAGTTTPGVPPTDLAGEVHGFVTAVDVTTSQITLDKVDWFTGVAAQQACAQDGVTQTDNNWCTGYYYRNVNPALRVVAVSPQATISTLQGSQSVPSDLGAVASRVGATGGTSAYRLVVTDGVVTELSEIYRP